ncbi:MAG: hypothetical protein Kow00128_16020 [Deltaproteobacteria bacterium]
MRTKEQLRGEIYRSYGRDFQDAPVTFDAASAARWGKAYRWYLRGWLPSCRDAAIAELACGRGRLLHFLQGQGFRNLYGVDISPDQVSLARQVVPGVDEADALGWLEGRRNQFDLLIALDLIEHFTREEALRFLSLCFAALKHRGRLVLQTPNADSPFGLQHRYNDITHEWAYNVNQLSRLLRRAGFVDIEPREQGPVAWGYGIASSMRWLAWAVIRGGLQVWNVVETGAPLPVLTRVMLISGRKGSEKPHS